MLALVLTELVPDAYARGGRLAAAGGTACGALVMLLLAAVLGVEGT
jgi:zinc transporter ZupT